MGVFTVLTIALSLLSACQAKKNQVNEFLNLDCFAQTGAIASHQNFPSCGCFNLAADTTTFQLDIGTLTVSADAYSDFNCQDEALLGSLSDGCIDPVQQFGATTGSQVIRSIKFTKYIVLEQFCELVRGKISAEDLQKVWQLGLRVGQLAEAALSERDLDNSTSIAQVATEEMISGNAFEAALLALDVSEADVASLSRRAYLNDTLMPLTQVEDILSRLNLTVMAHDDIMSQLQSS